ncbi:MAG TPA: tetratricopeptide repeat protein [Myxococcota bacterium]|nr:tetratricopeptide repeat protein [Myxococcota bacterium]
MALAPLASTAQPTADPRREQAERLEREGRCAPALELFDALRAEGAGDATLLLDAARCEVQLRQYERAAATLRQAEQLDPESGDIHLRLAIALYHEGDFAAAGQELDAAEQRLGNDSAELQLYRGLLLLERGDAADAAAALERARSLDAPLVEPVASYYAAVAWVSAREPDRAQADIDRVLAEWPGTPWSDAAERLRARLASERLRRWARLQIGFEYDSNAVLQASGAPLPSDISSKRDERGVWSMEAGAELFRSGAWSGGALAAYSGSAYVHVTQYDSNYPTVAAWLDRRLDDATTARLMLDSGYAWVDGEPFLWTYRGSLSLMHAWDRYGFTELAARFHRDDYFVQSDDVQPGRNGVGNPCGYPAPISFCGPPGLDERSARNRDGNGAVLDLHHSLKLPFDSLLRVGYEYEHFASRGTEYSYDAHSVLGDVLVPLPYRFTIDLAGVFTYRPYSHPSTFPDPPEPFFNTEYGLHDRDKLERFYGAGVRLERPIAKGITAAIAWRYERNHSNAQVFEYDRQIVGVYLTAALGD